MLLEKYLPQYHHRSSHSILIHATAEKITQAVDKLDVQNSILIRILYMLRGMPSRMLTRHGLQSGNFIELEKIEGRELIIGVIGRFWKISGNLRSFSPEEFIPFALPGFAKAVWHFGIVPEADGWSRLTTETRILCTDDRSRRRFSRYWFVIRPFSGLIRSEILKSIKKKCER